MISDHSEIEVLKNDEIPPQEWELLLKTSTLANAFQSKKYFELYNSIEQYRAEAIAIRYHGKITCLAVITYQKEKGLKSFFSKRAIIYGGPILDHEKSEINDFFLNLIHSNARKQIYLEIRNLLDYNYFNERFLINGWKYIPYLNFSLDLKGKTSIEEILKGMAYNRRREISISLKNGALVTECKSINELSSLYKILKALYTEKVKLPLPSFEFFKNFLLLDTGKIFIVKHNENIIGGSICPIMQDEAIYTLYYCGLRDYDKNIYPTHLAIYGAIDYAIKNRFVKFDFMGAGKPGQEYGVRKYKKEFGGELVEYGRYMKICKPLRFAIGKFGLSFYNKFHLH